MSASSGSEEEQEKINFFIPMVDLMVAVLFVFIIIIMVLVLLIREEEVSRAPSDAKIINQSPTLITNESAVGKLLDNITQKSLKREGSDFKLDEGTLRANIAVPDDNRVFKN